MKAKNHQGFSFTLYNQYPQESHIFELGDIIISTDGEDKIGVIIQLHEDGDYRNDHFGNCTANEIRLATESEIQQHRPKLLLDESIEYIKSDFNISSGLIKPEIGIPMGTTVLMVGHPEHIMNDLHFAALKERLGDKIILVTPQELNEKGLDIHDFARPKLNVENLIISEPLKQLEFKDGRRNRRDRRNNQRKNSKKIM